MSGIPVRELVKARTVSKTSKVLIDGHVAAIVRPTKRSHRARIRAEANHLHNSIPLLFDQAIFGCYQYYGGGVDKCLEDGVNIREDEDSIEPNARMKFCVEWLRNAFPDLLDLYDLTDIAIDLGLYVMQVIHDGRSSRFPHTRDDELIPFLMQIRCDPLAVVKLANGMFRLDVLDVYACDSPIAEHKHEIPDGLLQARKYFRIDCRIIKPSYADGRCLSSEDVSSWLGFQM